MSVSLSSARSRGKGEVTQQAIQKMLDENHHLIQCIMDYQSKGKTAECTQYQQILHRNLVYLATIADSNQNMQSLLPAPPTTNLSMPQSGGHALSNLNDITPGLPPTSIMQSQMSNGPGHFPTQQQSSIPSVSLGLPASSYNGSTSASSYSRPVPSTQGSMIQGPSYGSSSSSTSTSSSSSSSSSRSHINIQSNQAQAGGQHYHGQQALGVMGQASQGSSLMSQRPMGAYHSSQQGSAQQYVGQDEFYGEQYGHNQSSSEPMTQQYYPDGHGEYSYQQPSYGEQGYDRSFDETSHYYEAGNSQYSQQQAQFQQGSGQQQPFSQQQYSAQQSYSGQPQGYGAGQGASTQYTQYQQGQSQQYGSYRSSQGGPGSQAQRPYSYEQGQYGNYQQ